MSYLVLARKCRPQKFQDVVGQSTIVRILQNALRRKRVAHAMIFSGVRGVGKTTLARIMAKALNCHNSAEAPCDHCSSCEEIKAGTSLDLHEIDGASNRGIQEIRDLKENLRFLPTKEKYKIIIIDEVHMLTMEAFNALLKTLEEPPEHVFFMFATTELHKVPITILSRCQRYELKRIAFAELVSFFAKIADQEGMNISPAALDIIAREADGSVRDGLGLLDQVFSFGGETVTEDDLTQILGLVDNRVFARLAAALLAADLAAALELLHDIYGQGMNTKRFSLGLLQYLRSLLICKICRQPEAILDISDQEMIDLEEIAAKYSIETLSNIFNIIFQGVDGMRYSSYPRAALEMIFIKAAHAGNIVPVSSLLGRLDALLAAEPLELASAQPVTKSTGTGGTSSLAAGQIPVSAPVQESQKIESGSKSVAAEHREILKHKDVSANIPPADSPADEENLAPPVPASEDRLAAPVRAVQRDWDGFVGHVKERKKWMASALELSVKAREKNNELIIKFDDSSECLYLQEPENIKLLAEFAQDFFQRELTVKIVVNDGRLGDKLGGGEAQEERRTLARDPRVEMSLEVLGGEIAGIRTGPRSR
ncbi:MAG: DNA polymerase III subunit gamma/tau [Deltaproteobacteria bacterium]|nr:DNA polymerase III subunit gamma/tau [Deltaproteobacteria bacterium]